MPPKKTTAPTTPAAETPTTTSTNQEAQATGHAVLEPSQDFGVKV